MGSGGRGLEGKGVIKEGGIFDDFGKAMDDV